MAAKYIKNDSGQLAEVEATTSSAGAGDAGKIVGLDSSGRIDQTMMPTGIGVETEAMLASETLSAGDLVNIFNDAGTRKARKADNSNARRAHGFVLAGVTSAATATVYMEGALTGLTSITFGAPYYLGTTGAHTATAPTAAGTLSQEIGIGVSTTSISFEPQQPITLA
jgi:hypothetical protein